jgi:hypothetical protein
MNNEKAVFTFEKVNDTIITVVEALGGKQVTQEKEKHPLVGMWVQCVDWDGKYHKTGKWYQVFCNNEHDIVVKDEQSVDTEILHPVFSTNFNLSDPRPYNPDRVKELVGKKVKHIPSGEYHEFVGVDSFDAFCEVGGVCVKTKEEQHTFRGTLTGEFLYADYDLSDYQNIEEILYVPDEIRFYEWTGDITLEVSEDWFLCYDSKNQAHNFIGGIKASPIAMVMPAPIKCKLIPVKYEDIQVGDFVTVYGVQDKITSYSMKHGDHKFCGMEDDGFSFNESLYSEYAGKLLKVVKA